jgi:hypothetical protein
VTTLLRCAQKLSKKQHAGFSAFELKVCCVISSAALHVPDLSICLEIMHGNAAAQFYALDISHSSRDFF